VRNFGKRNIIMQLLWWILVGLVMGWSAGKVLKGNGYGPLEGIAAGICGAVAGGLLLESAGLTGYRGTIATTLVAMVGAALLMLLSGAVNGRRALRPAALSAVFVKQADHARKGK
jgi:uncharacterized membrane protein YeaQ/YmgE (transglycosylase-associated protein family)